MTAPLPGRPGLRRAADWPERLLAYVEARAETPFAWGPPSAGGHDCCSFAAGAVRAMTGVDLMDDLPVYASAEEADLVLAPGLPALMDARLPRVSVGLAARGDIALVRLPVGAADAPASGQDALAVVDGGYVLAPGRRRLARLPRRLMIHAWSV